MTRTHRFVGPSLPRAAALLAVVAAALAAAAPTAAQTVYDGAARVLSLRQMTVVYPARDDGGLARFSAETRAGVLREAANVTVRIARDDEVTDEQLAGNLLVLGWDNALLRDAALGGAPIVGKDGWRWLGLAAARDDDLVVSHRSPWNPERWLTFYSRIDPELDRLSALPLIGSDWIVLRRYLPVAQGMFTDAPAWPPTLDEIGQQDRRGELAASRVVDRSEHYVLRTTGAGPLPPSVADILASREAAWATAIAALGSPAPSFSIDLFVYDDDEAKTAATGVPDPWHSVPRDREIHAVPRAAVSVTPHEDVHVVARQRFGPAHLSALFEGVAVSIERGGADGPLATDAAWLTSAGLVPTVDELLDENRFRALTARKIGWPAAGLLVEWIVETHGLDGVAKSYGLLDGSATALAARLGTSAEAIEAGFAAHVAARAAVGSVRVDYERALIEARRRLDGGDLDGAVAAYRELLTTRPDDHGVRYRLGLALLDGGRVVDAATELRGLIDRTDPAVDARWHVFGRFLLGRALEKQGRIDEALTAWRAMLALPDVNHAHRTAREAIERVSAQAGAADGSDGAEGEPQTAGTPGG